MYGRLDAYWSAWTGGLAIAHEIVGDGLPVTTLTGAVVDQAALYGVLGKLRDLNLGLISVTLVASAWEAIPDGETKSASQTGFCPL